MAGARPLDATTLAALDDPYVKPVFFVQVAFDDGTVYLHDDLGTITFTYLSVSYTHLGVGDLGSIEGLEERDDGSPVGLTLRLSALNQALLDEVLLEDFFRRPAVLLIGFRDLITSALITTPILLFRGFINDIEVSAGQSPSLAVHLETELQAWARPLNRYFSDSECQKWYPGALGAKYMAAMANHRVTIGNKTLVSVSETLSNGSGGKAGGGGRGNRRR